MHLGTARFEPGAYTAIMKRKSIQVFIAVLWVSAVIIAGIAGIANSLSLWAVLAGIALLPPIVMMRWWNDPPQSMSESIQEARR